MEEYLIPKEEVADLLYNNPQQIELDAQTQRDKNEGITIHICGGIIFIYLSAQTR